MTAAVVAVVGTDATMVYDAVHNAVTEALGDLDPSVALEDFTAKDVTGGGESVAPRVLEALNTPPLLVDRRVVVVRDAQLLTTDEATSLLAWMGSPGPATTLVVAVVGAKSHRLVKAAGDVREVNVGSGARVRADFVGEKFRQYHVSAEPAVVEFVADRVGDDVARVDALARSLRSIYGSAPLKVHHVEAYVGDAGGVPAWDLTDAIDRGDATGAIVTARRMLDSQDRAGLQIVNLLQRHYLAMARLEGSGSRDRDEASVVLGIKGFPAEKILRTSQRLGAERIATAVRWVTNADVDLKGGVSYGGRDPDADADPTDLTVVEVLVARLAKLTEGARRR
ncbi:MAG: DNA polymerase III subunit delta [Acidimicrobiales bacterium]